MQPSAPRIWRDFGSVLSFQTNLIQTKPVLPLSNEHGSQVNDQDRRQCYNKHKTFPYRPTRDVSLLSGHASYTDNTFAYFHTNHYGNYCLCVAFVEWHYVLEAQHIQNTLKELS
jgi:hypothetical protein